MPIYKVSYGSMSATYGPNFIEASSEDEARKIFAGTAFSRGEMPLIHAREVSNEEIKRALQRKENE